MMKKSLIAATLAIASIGGVVSTQAAAQPTVYVRVAPPPPRAEVIPQARRGQVWVPGSWDWRGRQYVWVPGHFVRARPGYSYYEPVWVQRGDRWVKQPGNWRRGDRDRDGVPNQYDNHPNNPNRR